MPILYYEDGRMVNEDVFTPWIASTYINNQCELCSYYIPEWAKDTTLGSRYWHDGGTSSFTCPSCGRSCRKLFLSLDEELERVPDDYVMRKYIDPNILINKPAPKQPRVCYDHEAWMERVREWIGSRPAVPERAVKLHEVMKHEEQKEPQEMKTFKRRISV